MVFVILLSGESLFLLYKNKSIQNIIPLLVASKYRPLYFLIFLIIGVLGFYSCNPTKYVPEDKYLLNSVKVKLEGKGVKKDEIKGYIKHKPNKKIFGMRLYLGLYNLSNINKERGINKYLRKIGEEPSVWDPYVSKRTVDQLKTYLKRKGFNYSEVSVKDSINPKKRRVNLEYYINPGKPFKIRNIVYSADDTVILNILKDDTINTLLKRKSVLDEDILASERMRIENIYKNKGYFNFSKEYIYFDLDTSLQNGCDVYVQVNTNAGKIKNTKRSPYDIYTIRNVTIDTENNEESYTNPEGNLKIDTIDSNGIRFTYRENFYVRPSVILQSNYILPGKTFRIGHVDQTRKYLHGLNVFSVVDVQFKEAPRSDTSKLNFIDCNISLKPLPIQSSTIEVEGTNSSGNLGFALNWIYQNRSLFGNAELFNLKLRTAVEAIKQLDDNQINKVVEYGVEASINLPKFLLPLNSIVFIKKYNPKTNISTSYNYQRRPDFTRTVANISFGYNWKQDWDKSHVFNPVEMNYVDIPYISPYFRDSIINGTYLENSYTNHMVTLTSYSFIYNNQNINKTSDFNYFRLNVEAAGNLVTLVNKMTNSRKYMDSDSGYYYKLFGTRYSQYIKADIDYRYYQKLATNSMLVYRFFAGVAYPYGNAKAVPFEKQYFAGGANSIRGWQVRSLGPGNYKEPVRKLYPNSTGDIKLEGNIEYRFKLFWLLNGALFTDAGNVWTILDPENMPEARFRWNGFVDDIAVGSGFGLRFDMKFFLFRTDLGLKMRDPSRNPGDRWIFSQNKLMASDFAISIAIAYPF